jgi:hypothetical protein
MFSYQMAATRHWCRALLRVEVDGWAANPHFAL